MIPSQVKHRFFTPGVIVLIGIALNGLVFLAIRFIWGIGAVTNLDNNTPWGLWIGVDVAAGVALAAGGFTSAALGHVIHREHYRRLSGRLCLLLCLDIRLLHLQYLQILDVSIISGIRLLCGTGILLCSKSVSAL